MDDTPALPLRPAAAIWRRWPTLAGLAMGLFMFLTTDSWRPGDDTTWLLPLLALAYLAFGAARGELRRPGVLTLQGAGLLAYILLAVIALVADPDVGRYVVAAGWLAHAVWDAAHLKAGRVVPRWYAEWCIWIDLLVGASLLFLPGT
ncbi:MULTISPECIES: hypothetical protein [Streptosporangium]|uniref:DUF4260 domain-containing protein n=1 Tax=Streptosporangium brasiliense TaxID=47480 RepID=A0ABT9RAQ6_9ACTN|nr:hypothetical protein [Streptosporangium brasiliense]MDP9866341.1 hypothetical protein [Streptosporangium brasiliense]